MKKLCWILLVLFLVGCSQPAESDVVLPPTRVGKTTARAELADRYDMDSAVGDSDMIAYVRIGNWVEEDDHSTYYEAVVVAQYKGESVDNIIIKQDGNSECTIKGYELFTHGDEMVLFLRKASNRENTYWITGSYTTIFDVQNGEIAVDRAGILKESIPGYTNSLEQLEKFIAEKVGNKS